MVVDYIKSKSGCLFDPNWIINSVWHKCAYSTLNVQMLSNKCHLAGNKYILTYNYCMMVFIVIYAYFSLSLCVFISLWLLLFCWLQVSIEMSTCHMMRVEPVNMDVTWVSFSAYMVLLIAMHATECVRFMWGSIICSGSSRRSCETNRMNASKEPDLYAGRRVSKVVFP
jgi:hypothetical protein